VGGIVGGAIGGLILDAAGLIERVGAIYGAESAAAGWVASMAHSVVFALLFAAMVRPEPLYGRMREVFRVGALAVLWALILWFVGTVVLMPLWLEFIGSPLAPTIPNLTLGEFTSWLAYGIALGVLYPLLTGEATRRYDVYRREPPSA